MNITQRFIVGVLTFSLFAGHGMARNLPTVTPHPCDALFSAKDSVAMYGATNMESQAAHDVVKKKFPKGQTYIGVSTDNEIKAMLKPGQFFCYYVHGRNPYVSVNVQTEPALNERIAKREVISIARSSTAQFSRVTLAKDVTAYWSVYERPAEGGSLLLGSLIFTAGKTILYVEIANGGYIEGKAPYDLTATEIKSDALKIAKKILNRLKE